MSLPETDLQRQVTVVVTEGSETVRQIETSTAGKEKPTTAPMELLRRVATRLHMVTKSLPRNRRVFPIAAKIRPRHLEMEPLCCISSCLVRGGCTAIVCFEVIYVLATIFLTALKINRERSFWTSNDFSPSFSTVVTHQFFLYVVGIFDVVTIIMVIVLSQALITFDKQLVRFHWYFDFVSLIFNSTAFIFYLLAVIIEGNEQWNIINIALTVCFAMQIPLQLWAITVVRSCYDFFNLLLVFIQLAEK